MNISTTIFLALLSGTGAAPASDGAGDKWRCQVWEREASFAASVQSHDADGFAEHLRDDAVFNIGSKQAHVGRDAVMAAWADIIQGKNVNLRWWPEHVHVNEAGDIASSSGPYLMERRDANGTRSHATGRFSSVWVRGDDGEWRVQFDGGTPSTPIDAAQAEAMASKPAGDCPAREVVREVRRT